MKDDEMKKIEEIMAGMKCPKNFKCAENGFEHLCRAEDFGAKDYLDCFENNPSGCAFAGPGFNSGRACCIQTLFIKREAVFWKQAAVSARKPSHLPKTVRMP